MFKPNYINIVFFTLLKFFVFDIFMMFKNNNFALIDISEIKNAEDLFYYLWIFLFFPVVYILLFSAPLYYSLKAKESLNFFLSLSGIFFLEYVMYTYIASQLSWMNGIWNLLIGIILFVLFYFKTIKKIIG